MNKSKPCFENEQRIKGASALRSHFIRCQACLLSGMQSAQKRNRLFFKRGQQVMEYALFIAAISAALVVMYVYTKRGIQNVIRISADQIGPQGDSAPLTSLQLGSTTTSRDESLTNDTMYVNKIGEYVESGTQSYTATSGVSATIYEERIK